MSVEINISKTAKEFGVDRKTIKSILEGKNWKHIYEQVKDMPRPFKKTNRMPDKPLAESKRSKKRKEKKIA